MEILHFSLCRKWVLFHLFEKAFPPLKHKKQKRFCQSQIFEVKKISISFLWQISLLTNISYDVPVALLYKRSKC